MRAPPPISLPPSSFLLPSSMDTGQADVAATRGTPRHAALAPHPLTPPLIASLSYPPPQFKAVPVMSNSAVMSKREQVQ